MKPKSIFDCELITVIDRKGLYLGFTENPDSIVRIEEHDVEVSFDEILEILLKVPHRMIADFKEQTELRL